MVFLDPKSDIGFKKLFDNKKQPEIVISFLNSVLELKPGSLITTITINDPSNLPNFNEGKYSLVDISCTDQAGKNYIVEMQVIDQKDYALRAQYYASLGIANQLAKGSDYTTLKPVVFVGIVCFDLFKSTSYLSHHLILNKDTFEHGLELLTFHFIELPKFNKTLEELDGVVEKWVYLLKHADEMKAVPRALQKPIELEAAMEVLEQGNWSKKELLAYERYWDYLRTQRSRQVTALEKGMEKGLEKGRKEGRHEGYLDAIIQLLPVMDNRQIAKTMHVPIEKVEALRKKVEPK